MKKFLLLISNDDGDQDFEIVEAIDEKAALRDFLSEMFNLDENEDEDNDIEMCSSLLRDEYFAVAPIEVGPVEFTYYYTIESLGF